MSDNRELLLVVGHAYICQQCREKMLADPARTLAGQRLNAEERKLISELKEESFRNPSDLARLLGSNTSEFYEIMSEPRCRLRHF